MADPNPRQMVCCPFNKSHHIEHYRMHVHLQKCRKQHQHLPKVACPLDATHMVLAGELDYHLETCTKRAMLDSAIYITDNDHRPVVEVQTTTSIVDGEEDWGLTNASTYDPSSKQGQHIIRKIKGATPSERKKARGQAIRSYKPLDQQ